jgi:hypothetical protein
VAREKELQLKLKLAELKAKLEKKKTFDEKARLLE